MILDIEAVMVSRLIAHLESIQGTLTDDEQEEENLELLEHLQHVERQAG